MFDIILECFGRYYNRSIVCNTDSLSAAILLSELLFNHFNNRPFKITIKYKGDDDLEYYLNSFCYDGEREIHEYFNGIYT